MKKITVDIIIVNWNSGSTTITAIESYLNDSSDIICCNIIVVDNFSSDNSIEQLRQLPLTLIESEKNLGFGQACNTALEYCIGKYVLLLNPDTKSHISVLEGLVIFLETQPDFAITGPQQLAKNNSIQKSCGRFPTFKTAFYEVTGISKIAPQLFTPAPIMLEWKHNISATVDHIMGSYMLIDRKVIELVGFMDDAYFVYWEDLDFSKRVDNAGLRSYYNTAFSIIHAGGESGDNAKSKRLYYSIASRRVYWSKHLSKPQRHFLIFISLTIEPLLRVFECLLLAKFSRAKEVVGAYTKYLRSIITGIK